MSTAHLDGKHSGGFTLMELLVVIAIIMTIVSMLFVVLSMVIFQAKSAKTCKIINDVENALVSCGVQEGSSAIAIQRRANLGGVLTFRRKASTSLSEPDVGAWQDITLPYRFGFPWESENRIASTDPNVTSVVRDSVTMTVSSATLKDLSPLATIRLLEIAGILPADDPITPVDESAVEWGKRSTNRPWNDAWGNPLVVAWGLYQPVSEVEIAAALRHYQYGRAVYFAVAAGGPKPPALTGVVATDEAAIWDQANRICQPTLATSWTERGWVIPPWSGVKQGKGVGVDKGRYGFLTVPHSLR